MITNQNQSTPFRDPLYQLGRTALRQANTAFLPHVLRNIGKKLDSKTGSDYMEAEFRIISADVARTLDQDGLATEMIRQVINHPPPAGGMEILSRAQRVQAALLLDASEVENARLLAEEIDALVIINSEARGGDEQVFSRNESDVSVETLLLQAEIALFAVDRAEAGKFLIAAAKRLAAMEIDSSTTKRSAFQLRQNMVFCVELRYKLHFWEAALRIASGDEEGFTMLKSLGERMEGDTRADRRILARIRAMLGEFDIETSAPVGIGRREAMRLFALATHEVVNFTKQVWADAGDDNSMSGERNDLMESLPVSEVNPAIPVSPVALLEIASPGNGQNGNYLPPQVTAAIEKLSDSQVATNMQMTAIFEQIGEVLRKIPVQSTTLAADEQKRRPFAFGGGFAFFDLVTQLGNAEAVHFTGFFQCQWSPDMVETSVLAGNLDPLARVGEGFVFMKDGTIIDATIGSYDAPAEFASGTPGAEMDAKRSLTVMVQVGIGQKLDYTPDGFGEGYPSMAVKERTPRLKYRQINLAILITERDDELK